MKIIVTGSSGKIGQRAVAALKEAGHKVTCTDLRPQRSGPPTIPLDCTDFGQVMGAFSGIDVLSAKPEAVLHLAGIPAPAQAPDQTTFEVNTVATYNVFSACARLGIHHVVWASSESVLGLPFSRPPDFAPLDETHPDRPEWSYSLSKQLGEQMADNFVRWHPAMSIASLRFSNVFDEQAYQNLARLQAEPGQRRVNLWSYIDVRDAGMACRLALEAKIAGHQRMIVAAADNIIGRPSAALMREYYPDVPLRTPLDGEVSLYSSARAAELIGYRARFSWRDR